MLASCMQADNVKWKQFERVEVNGRKQLDIVQKTTPVTVLVSEFQKQFPKYVKHSFENAWQRSQFNACLDGQWSNELITTADFSERFDFQYDHEIQSMHWVSKSCSLFVIIAYLPSPDITVGKPWAEMFGFWSDDKKQVI